MTYLNVDVERPFVLEHVFCMDRLATISQAALCISFYLHSGFQ